MRIHRALLAAFLAPLALAAPAVADVVDVDQVSLTFVPADIVINEGDTVVWHWSMGNHTVSEGTDGAVNGNEAFHSPLTSAVPTYSVTFDAAFLAANPRPGNRYDYFCAPHFNFGMTGSVTVCAPAPTTYCTSRPSSIPGCTPAIGYSGAPSLAQGSGFDVTAGPMPGSKLGLMVYTNSGAAANPVSNAFGFLCINTQGVFRFGTQSTGGTSGSCNGQMSVDFVAFALAQTQNPNLVAGASVDVQAWYRDPANSGGANLTDALHFVLCP
jgi:plastocyanin